MKIADIKIGNRFRKDLGDIQTLANSIQEIGLLQPIVINQNNELIAGQRRLEAGKILGWNEIPVTVVNLDNIVKGEFHENAVRKEFTLSERVAILEEVERQRIGHRTEKGVKFTPFQEEEKDKKSRDIVAQYTGVSNVQLSKEKKIVEAARRDPDRFSELLAKVDSGREKVHKAYHKVLKEEAREMIKKGLFEEKPRKIFLDNDQVMCLKGDFLEESTNHIEDNSVDLIFTDPIIPPSYGPDDRIALYKDLGDVAARVLKEGGSMLAYAPLHEPYEALNTIIQAGLKYWWIIGVKHTCSCCIFQGADRSTISSYRLSPYFVKGKTTVQGLDYVNDFVKSVDAAPEYFIQRLTVENQTVLDPFVVGWAWNTARPYNNSNTAEAAFKLNRKFIGIENGYHKVNLTKENLGEVSFQ